jgi:hypothetical protein
MKLFQHDEVQAALAHADAGGQALHVWRPPNDGRRSYWPGAPEHFLQHLLWAHLIDHDEKRLIELARSLGLMRVYVHRRGRRGQHVDLCGEFLQRAIRACERMIAPGDHEPEAPAQTTVWEKLP